MELRFELPTEFRKKDALMYRDEFEANGDHLSGDGGLGKAKDYNNWVLQKQDWHNEVNVPEEYVPSSTYFAIRESDDKIVGMIDLRHCLNENLKKNWWGHIGYSVRPDERRKGYATEMLKFALKEYESKGFDLITIGCDKDNIGSKKTILKCGGVLKNESVQKDKAHLGFEINLGEVL